MKVSQAVITLGGQGTRLQAISASIPKPLYPVCGISTLERAIAILTREGVNDFVFLLGNNSDAFVEICPYLERTYKCAINIYIESSPLGEAGALFHVLDLLQDIFLFVNGDIIFDVSLKHLSRFFADSNADIALVTHFTNHPEDSDCVLESPSARVVDYKLKSESLTQKPFFLGYSGLSMLKREVLLDLIQAHSTSATPCSFFQGIAAPSLLKSTSVVSYNTTEYLKDMGTPDRLETVFRDLASGRVSSLSYRNQQSALFIDRDNTIVRCPPGRYILSTRDIEILDLNVRCISDIAKNYDFVVCITNQPQVAMGLLPLSGLALINSSIAIKCSVFDLKISSFYCCPHHPHDGYPEEIPELKARCSCRKPMPGLVYQASIERNIDLSTSMFIGDSQRDELLAQATGLKYMDVRRIDGSNSCSAASQD